MTKLINMLEGLTCKELEKLIEESKQKINELKRGDQVRLIAVCKRILVLKYFKLADKDKAISYAHEHMNKQLNDSTNARFGCDISIETTLVPESDVDSYLEMNDD
ncbi:hypothetical protein [Gilliamella sp. Bif1-4]|uniref:hypothetical protein n=1 Tax=Gilliamella sp. Bif1-4 TaxID=3120233 RepID=UPI00080E933B|nr:hypothetical protein [Gilliamella apicola]OCG39747.1 hypothetical protein A9G25_10105 [Gilliamella apicola]